MYKEYVRCLDECLLKESLDELNDVKFNSSLLYQSWANSCCMTIKDYKKPGGLSSVFFNKEKLENGIFRCKGPVGKGLAIDKNTRGTHFAFTAGTGILVFIDLVMRIFLGNIKAIPEE